MKFHLAYNDNCPKQRSGNIELAVFTPCLSVPAFANVYRKGKRKWQMSKASLRQRPVYKWMEIEFNDNRPVDEETEDALYKLTGIQLTEIFSFMQLLLSHGTDTQSVSDIPKTWGRSQLELSVMVNRLPSSSDQPKTLMCILKASLPIMENDETDEEVFSDAGDWLSDWPKSD